jgi:ABC-type nitrate/sulfonate/bicarbonate transport system permease component
VLGEFLVAGAGVGSLVLRSSFRLRTDEMFAGMCTLVALALGIDFVIRTVQHRVKRW